MPVKIWELTDGFTLTGTVETERHGSLRGERYREEAEELDGRIDKMLDEAADLSSAGPEAGAGQGVDGRQGHGRVGDIVAVQTLTIGKIVVASVATENRG